MQENQFLKTQVNNFSRQMDKFRENLEIDKEDRDFAGYERCRVLQMRKGADCKVESYEYMTPKSNRNLKVEDKINAEDGGNRDFRINQIKYSEEKRMRNRSNNMSQILSWSPETQSPRSGICDALKEKLKLLLNDYEGIKSQLSQVSMKKGANFISRKKELEIELTLCENNINQINSRLRKISSISSCS